MVPDPYRNPPPKEPEQSSTATDQHREHCGERQIDTRVPVATVGMMPLGQQSIPIRAGSNSAPVVPVKKAETKTNAAPAVSANGPGAVQPIICAW